MRNSFYLSGLCALAVGEIIHREGAKDAKNGGVGRVFDGMSAVFGR